MRRDGLVATAGLVVLALQAGASDLRVGAGVSVDLGSSFLDTGEGDVDVEGTLSSGTAGFDARDLTIQVGGVVNGDSGTLRLCGDWSNAGTFTGGTSTVAMIDGCGVANASITGDTTFADLDLTTTTGKLYSFASGSTQAVTGSLTLVGATDNLLVLRSSVGGSAAFLNKQGTSVADFVDVDDIDASGGSQIALGSNSVQGPNTPGFGPAVVTALSVLSLAALAGSLLWGGHRTLAARIRSPAQLSASEANAVDFPGVGA